MVSLDSSCQRPGASVTKQQPISLLHEVLDGSGLVLALADATTAARRFYQLVGDLYRLLGARCHADCLRLPAAVRRVALHAPDGSLAPSPAPKPRLLEQVADRDGSHRYHCAIDSLGRMCSDCA